MAKPILTIDDFDTWITYDETESTINGFNDLQNIDLKTQLWIAQISKWFFPVSNSNNFIRNNTVWFDLIPDVNWTGKKRQHFYITDAPWQTNMLQLWYIDSRTNTSNLLYYPNSNPWAQFSEVELFDNGFYFSGPPNYIASCITWTTWDRSNITWYNTTTVDLMASFTGYPVMKADKSLTGGTLYYYSSGTWFNTNIVSVDNTTFTDRVRLVVWGTVPANTFQWYIINWQSTSVLRPDWTTLSLALPNASLYYRPLITFINNLYVGDGDMICQLDNLRSNFNITWKNWSISVGTNNTVKQFEQIWWYMYILADSFNWTINSSFIEPPKFNSKLYIWDWISNEFTNIIDIWAHCYSIKVIENRIYALIDSWNNDWVLFSYFNGADFPTIAKLQVSYPKCPINWIAYDRGRFYFAVNERDSSLNPVAYHVFSYSSYAIEQSSVTKEYTFYDNFYYLKWIDFIKDWLKSYLMISTSQNWTAISLRDWTKYNSQGTIQTQKYEITPNQFWQLVRWIQVNCKEAMPNNTSITLKYRWDEETNFTTLSPVITSANQNQVIWGIMERYKKIQLQIILNTNDTSVSPKLIKIMLF